MTFNAEWLELDRFGSTDPSPKSTGGEGCGKDGRFAAVENPSGFPLSLSVRIWPARWADRPLPWPRAFAVICRRLAALNRSDLIGACYDPREVCRSLCQAA